jgi:hypothetical protein
VIRTKARRLNLNNPFVGFSAIPNHFNMCNRVAFYKYCLLNRDFESSKIISLGNSIVPDSENVKAPIHPHKQDNLAWEHDPSNRKTGKRILKKSRSRFLIVDQCPPDKNIRQNLSRSCDTTKHQQGNGQAQYQRAGTTTRKIITMVGELNLRLSKVKDTDNNTTSIPFYQCITFDGKRMYQPDIAMATVDLAEKLSYRDVVKAVSLLIDIAPWRRALIYKYMYSEALLMSRSISIRTRSINLHCRGERDEPGR